MTKYRYFSLDVLSWTADTLHLTNEEAGAFLRGLIALFINGGEMDFDDFVRAIGAPKNRWPRLWSRLGQFFELSDGNRIKNVRLLSTIERTKKNTDANRRRHLAMQAAKARRGKPLSKPAGKMTSPVTMSITRPPPEERELMTSPVTTPVTVSSSSPVMSGQSQEKALSINRQSAFSEKPAPVEADENGELEPANRADGRGDREGQGSVPEPRPAVVNQPKPASLFGRLEAHRRGKEDER